jgi:hypothetical protein
MQHVVRQRALTSRALGAVDLLPKQAVHKPFRPHRLATPQALAIKPEASAFRILGAEIVARRRSRVSPPGRGDALRPLNGRDIMQDAPPAEAQRGAIGHFSQGLDRLRAGEEAQRPRRGAAWSVIASDPRDCFVPAGQARGFLAMTTFAAHSHLSKRRGRGRLGLFGQMRIDKLAPRHRAGPEPRGESIEKLGQRTGAFGLVRALKFGFRGRKRLGREASEAHEVDAIAGVDGVFVRTGEPARR